MAATSIPAGRVAAFRATTYRVELPHRRRVDLRIGRRSIVADRLLAVHGAHCGAFLTAWNPYSRPRLPGINAMAQRALERDLARLRVPFLPGEGIGDDRAWLPERSVFAIGLTRQHARRLAVKYRQSGFVFVRRGAPAELVLP